MTWMRQLLHDKAISVFAALTLGAWLAAQVLCAGHCLLGHGHADSEHACYHDAATSQSDHDADSSEPCHDDSASNSCLVLRTALFSGAAPELIQPEFLLLYTLASFPFTIDATRIGPAMPIFRQAWRRDWVFTPEVSLGPAFRSLAPPIPL